MAQTAGGTYYAASSELVSSWPATSLDLANQLETRFAAKAPSASPTFTGNVATIGGVLDVQSYRADAFAGALVLSKSRGTGTTNTIVQSGDLLGELQFKGATGSTFAQGATILATVDGTPGATADMPTRLAFLTAPDGSATPAERLRITSDGTIRIPGADAGQWGAKVYVKQSSTTDSCFTTENVSGADRRVFMFYNGTTNVGYILTSTTATTYSTSSDYRLKENIEPITDALQRLRQLKPSRFNFIVEPDRVVDGFLAHEVQPLVPEAVNGVKDEVDDDGNPIYQGIDQSKLVPLLVAAMQEQQAQIDALTARLDAAGL